MYSQGLGVNVDIAEDVKWYKLAAEQGNAKAQSNLRAIYEQGKSITPRPC
jgi:TPR repeat protein